MLTFGKKQKYFSLCSRLIAFLSLSLQKQMDMKRSILLFPVAAILLVLSVSSCRDAGVRDALQRAEALMESDPHAARALLDSIASPNPPLKGRASESTSLPSFRRGKGEAALYALLRTQADYKCRVRLTSDSLPLIATNYYGTKRKTQRAALAQYYLGCAYSDMHRDLDAIDVLLRATTLFPDTTNKYYAFCLFELGSLYFKKIMPEESLNYFSLFKNHSVCNSDSVQIGRADYGIGHSHLLLSDSILADGLLRRVIANPYVSNFYHSDAYFQLAKLALYFNHRPDEAVSFIDSCLVFLNEKQQFGALFAVKADAMFTQGKYDSAYMYSMKALSCERKDVNTTCWANKQLAKASLALGKTDSVAVFYENYTALLDSSYEIRKRKEIRDIENNHIIEIHDREQEAERSRIHRTWGALLLTIVFAAVIGFLLVDRNRKNELLKNLQELKNIKEKYISQKVQREDALNNAENTLNLLRKEQSDGTSEEEDRNKPPMPSLIVQEKSIAIYRKQYESSEWAKYFNRHQSNIINGQTFMPTGDVAQFGLYLSDLFVDFYLDIVKDNPGLNHQDLEYCAMTILGFKPNQIAYYIQRTPQACYNRRNRLAERLTPDWYLLIFDRAPKR